MIYYVVLSSLLLDGVENRMGDNAISFPESEPTPGESTADGEDSFASVSGGEDDKGNESRSEDDDAQKRALDQTEQALLSTIEDALQLMDQQASESEPRKDVDVIDDSFASNDEDSKGSVENLEGKGGGGLVDKEEKEEKICLEKMADDADSFDFSKEDFERFDHIEVAETPVPPCSSFVESQFDHFEQADAPTVECTIDSPKKETSQAVLTAISTRESAMNALDDDKSKRESVAARRIQTCIRQLQAQYALHHMRSRNDVTRRATENSTAAHVQTLEERRAETVLDKIDSSTIVEGSYSENPHFSDADAEVTNSAPLDTPHELASVDAYENDNAVEDSSDDTFAIGDFVEGYFDSVNEWYPGKIAKVHANGTYDVGYDDGDFEEEVESSSLRRCEEKNRVEKECPTSDHNSTGAGASPSPQAATSEQAIHAVVLEDCIAIAEDSIQETTDDDGGNRSSTTALSTDRFNSSDWIESAIAPEESVAFRHDCFVEASFDYWEVAEVPEDAQIALQQELALIEKTTLQEQEQVEKGYLGDTSAAVIIQACSRKRYARIAYRKKLKERALVERENAAATRIQTQARRRRAAFLLRELVVAKANQIRLQQEEMAKRQYLTNSILEDSLDDSVIEDSTVNHSIVEESIAENSVLESSYDDGSFDDEDADDALKDNVAEDGGDNNRPHSAEKNFDNREFDYTELAVKIDVAFRFVPESAAAFDYMEEAMPPDHSHPNFEKQADDDDEALTDDNSMLEDSSIREVLKDHETLMESNVPDNVVFVEDRFDYTEIAQPATVERELSSSHKSVASIMSDSDGAADDRSVGENDIFDDYDVVVDLEAVDDGLLDNTIDSPGPRTSRHRDKEEETDVFDSYDHIELADNVEDVEVDEADDFEEMSHAETEDVGKVVSLTNPKDEIADQFFDMFLEDAINEAKFVMNQPPKELDFSGSSCYDDNSDEDERMAELDMTGALMLNTRDFENPASNSSEERDFGTFLEKSLHRVPDDWSVSVQDAVRAILDASPSVDEAFGRVQRGTSLTVSVEDVDAFDETVKEQAIRIFETVQVDGAAVKYSSTLMRSVFDGMNEILRKEKRHQIDISHLTPKQRRTAMAKLGPTSLQQLKFASKDDLAIFFRAKIDKPRVSVPPNLRKFRSLNDSSKASESKDAKLTPQSLTKSVDDGLSNLADISYQPKDVLDDCVEMEKRVNNHGIKLAHRNFSFDLQSHMHSLGLPDAEIEALRIQENKIKVSYRVSSNQSIYFYYRIVCAEGIVTSVSYF
jgi:hypothetical protein